LLFSFLPVVPSIPLLKISLLCRTMKNQEEGDLNSYS